MVVNAQKDVDISHESFIRRWKRLREWVEHESRSRRIYTKLADVAASWEGGAPPSIGGRSSSMPDGGGISETPTQTWANRYDARFDAARRFLVKSVRGRRLRLGLLFGNIALLLVAAASIAVLMQVRAAEALAVRNNADIANRKLEDANRILEQALALQREGKTSQADA